MSDDASWHAILCQSKLQYYIASQRVGEEREHKLP